jgi:energy-coupling factor transport system ATP-binding protein
VTGIRIDGVTFRYAAQPEHAALNDVSCAVGPGQFLGITGPADAGKSTLCRLIAGYIPHFFRGELSGAVSVGDVTPADVPLNEMAARVGYVFENPFDQLTGAGQTVFEEIAFALENMGLERSEIRRRTEHSLAQVGIADLADRHPGHLSGGQSQRLAIASVLAIRPDVLVLDEPTSHLDPLGAEGVLAVVRDLRAAGYTVVVVTQDLQGFARELDWLVVLDGGRVRQQGPPRTVLADASPALVRLPPTVAFAQVAAREGVLDDGVPLPLTVAEVLDALPPRASAGDGAAPPAVEAPPRVTAEDLHYHYPSGVHALRGLSLELASGCVAVVGENGAGKTSLVKHFNGLLRPTSGRVLVDGQDTAGVRVARLARDVALSFQNPDDQLFRRTVADEVRFGPANLGYAEDRIAALSDAALRRLGLEDVREVRPHELGLPWRKRVAVASAIAMDTPVVVLDEPTGGQDAPGIVVLGALIGELVAAGVLVVVVTHDVEFAYEHATRVVALLEGRVLLDGAPGAVFRHRDELARTHVVAPVLVELADALGVGAATIDELVASLRSPG